MANSARLFFDELSGLPVEAAEIAKIAHRKTVCDL